MALSGESQWRPCCAGKFIRNEIKMVMVFLPGPATAYPTATAQVLLARCSPDSMAQPSEQAKPRGRPKRRVVFREAPAADLSPQLVDRDFPSLALRLKSVSAFRLVSVKQMELRTARGRPREQQKLLLPVWQSDQRAAVLSLLNPQPLIPSRARLESAPRLCSCRSRRKSQALSHLPRAPLSVFLHVLWRVFVRNCRRAAPGQ